MKKQELKHLIEEAVLNQLNESPAWAEIEKKLNKWFKLSPSMAGNIKSLTADPEMGGAYRTITLHDKRGNVIPLLKGASADFIKRYLPLLSNLLSTLSGQTASQGKSPDEILFK